MKRIFYAILLLVLLANVCLAKVVRVGNIKDLQIIKESVAVVNVRAPAKSKKIECEVRIDFMDGLLKTGICDVFKVRLLDKNEMWIGDLIPEHGYDAESNYEKNGEFNNLICSETSKIAYVDVEFFADIDKTDILDFVKCPDTYETMYDESKDEAYCFKAYDCKLGEYAVDEDTCEKLPKNAVRNETEGFSCKKGFVLVYSEDGYVCEKNK